MCSRDAKPESKSQNGHWRQSVYGVYGVRCCVELRGLLHHVVHRSLGVGRLLLDQLRHRLDGGQVLGGGDARLVVGAALSSPPPLEYFASRGWRLVASLQAGVLSASAPYPWESGNNGNAAGSRSGGGGGTGVGLVARAAEEVRASASVGVGIPVGRGSELSLLCSRPLQLQPQDRPEKWQIAISLGIG